MGSDYQRCAAFTTTAEIYIFSSSIKAGYNPDNLSYAIADKFYELTAAIKENETVDIPDWRVVAKKKVEEGLLLFQITLLTPKIRKIPSDRDLFEALFSLVVDKKEDFFLSGYKDAEIYVLMGDMRACLL